MKNWTVRKRIIFGFAFLLSLWVGPANYAGMTAAAFVTLRNTSIPASHQCPICWQSRALPMPTRHWHADCMKATITTS
jgi:hypothetical protein